MKLTNDSGLPEALVSLIEKQADEYSRGDAVYSITSLLRPAWQSHLMNLHVDEIVEDASDRLWSFFGSLAHSMLEQSGKENPAYLLEKRFFTTSLGGIRISGAIDSYHEESGWINDWKINTVYKYMADENGLPSLPEEYVWQQNGYALLLRDAGLPVEKITLTVILRDWSRRQAAANPDYPQKQALFLAVPILPDEEVRAFFLERLHAHEATRSGRFEEPCSLEERWAKPPKWAVIKPGNKRARALFDNEVDAWNNARPNEVVEFREPQNVRCEHYCPVAQWCPIGQATNDKKNLFTFGE